MKKIALAIAAALMMTSTVMAQETKKGEGQPRKFDKTEMVKHRTDQMVKQYGLNAKQQKQLQALNETYADKMGPRGRHFRHHGKFGQRPDSIKGKRPMPPKDGQKPAFKGGQKPSNKDFGKMDETMKAYEAELQKIMTADQYKSYKADMEKRRKEGPRGHHGSRPDKAPTQNQ